MKSKHGDLPYWLLHFVERQQHLIDYELTTWKKRSNDKAAPVEFMRFGSYEQYEKTRQSSGIRASISELYVKPELYEYDYFSCVFPSGWFVTQKLADEIKRQQLTGMKLIPYYEKHDCSVSVHPSKEEDFLEW
jgi:hypothetical protein